MANKTVNFINCSCRLVSSWCFKPPQLGHGLRDPPYGPWRCCRPPWIDRNPDIVDSHPLANDEHDRTPSIIQRVGSYMFICNNMYYVICTLRIYGVGGGSVKQSHDYSTVLVPVALSCTPSTTVPGTELHWSCIGMLVETRRHARFTWYYRNMHTTVHTLPDGSTGM